MFKLYKGYSIASLLMLFLSLIYTKIFFTRARLIRLPLRLRKVGNLTGGESLTLGVNNRIDIFQDATLKFGRNVQINDFCHVACSQEVSIGDDTLIASRVFITDHDHDYNSGNLKPIEWPLNSKAVNIGKECWIGEGVCILKGVSIGDRTIVAANSVVTKTFPNDVVLGGIPAKIIKSRGSNESFKETK